MKNLFIGGAVGIIMLLVVASTTINITPVALFPNNPSPSGNLLLLLSNADIGNYNISLNQFINWLSTNSTFTVSVQTNLTTWSTYPTPTNTLTINNGFWRIATANNVAITNISGFGIWSTLFVNNTGTNGILLTMTIGDAGINSTNSLPIASGKWGVVSFNTDNSTLTNYCDTTFQ